MVLHVIVIYQTKISCNSHFVHQKTQGVGVSCCTDHVRVHRPCPLLLSICRVDLSLGENSDLPGVVSTRPSPGEEIQGLMEDSSIFWCRNNLLVNF